jgi:hypothetical protein
MKSRAPGRAIDITYDATGQVHGLATGDGETLTFTHDGPLLLTEAAAGSVNATLAFDYDADFNLAARHLDDDAISTGRANEPLSLRRDRWPNGPDTAYRCPAAGGASGKRPDVGRAGEANRGIDACRRQIAVHGSPNRSARTSRAPCTTRTMMTSVSVKR